MDTETDSTVQTKRKQRPRNEYVKSEQVVLPIQQVKVLRLNTGKVLTFVDRCIAGCAVQGGERNVYV
jgi:hypothetical protein